MTDPRSFPLKVAPRAELGFTRGRTTFKRRVASSSGRESVFFRFLLSRNISKDPSPVRETSQYSPAETKQTCFVRCPLVLPAAGPNKGLASTSGNTESYAEVRLRGLCYSFATRSRAKGHRAAPIRNKRFSVMRERGNGAPCPPPSFPLTRFRR